MRFWWLNFTTSIRLAMADSVSRRRIRIIYWSIMLTLVGGSVVAAAVYNQRGHDAAWVTGDMAGARSEMRETVITFTQDRREANRLGDFEFVLEHLQQSYPFFEMALRGGVDISHLSQESLYELSERARYIFDAEFLSFINDNFISAFHPLGGISITSEAGGLAPWLQLPYFFGYYDWRFDDDRMYVPTRDDNIAAEFFEDDNAVHVRIGAFLPRGYDDFDRRPFWRYDFAEERLRIRDITDEANRQGIENLIFDIRGITVGFADYFLPLIIEPNITKPISTTVYGFHMDGEFAHYVSAAFRQWYDLGDLQPASQLAANMYAAMEEDFANLAYGFRMEIAAEPHLQNGDILFDGNIWILTDAHNFVGKNSAYLDLAAQAGFHVVFYAQYDSRYAPAWNNPWGAEFNAFTRTPTGEAGRQQSGPVLRYNPIYFTDADGRAFEFERHSHVAQSILLADDAIEGMLRGLENN